MTPGVYLIRCIPTGRVYVGSTMRPKDRWSYHKSVLSRKTHPNPRLQEAWNQYGRNAFVFEVVKRVEPERLAEFERFYIDLYYATDPECGFNCIHVTNEHKARRKKNEVAPSNARNDVLHSYWYNTTTGDLEMHNTVVVRMNADSLTMARQAAAHRKMTVPQYLSLIVGEAAERDLNEFARKWQEHRQAKELESGSDYM